MDGLQRRLSEKVSYASILTAGASGAGKTSTCVYPNLFTLDNCSIVVTDVKGDLYKQSSGYLAKQGFKIKVLNLMDLTRSHGFNPVLGANTFSQVSKLAHQIINASPSTGGKDSGYWDAGSEKFLRIILMCLRNQGDPSLRHLGEVKRLISTFDHFTAKPGESVFGNWVLQNTVEDPCTWAEYKTLIANPAKICASFVSSADVALLPLGNPELSRLLQYDELNFAELRETKTIFYLLCNQSDMSHYGFVLSALFSRMYSTLLREMNPDHLSVYCLLDEIGQVTIPRLDTYLTTARDYRVATWGFLQDFSQLETRYGRSQAETIIKGVQSNLYLPGMDLDTAERVSRRLGRKRPLPGEKPLPHAEAALMTPDQLITMKDEALLLSGRNRPSRFRIKPYFKRAKFRRNARMEPAALPYLGQSIVPEVVAPEEPELEIDPDFDLDTEVKPSAEEAENAS